MRTRFGGPAALALAVCLPCAPAQAETATETAAEDAALEDGTAAEDESTPESGWSLAPAPPAEAAAPPPSPASIEPAPGAYGPPPASPSSAIPNAETSDAAVPLTPSGHVPREYASHRGFFRQVGSIGTEMAIMTAYVGAQSIPKLFKPTAPFHFQNEGWFGKDTHNIGVDKLTHAFNTYLIAELLHYRLHRNTGGSEGDALTAGVLAAGLMALNEVSDAIEPDSGYSMQDITMNIAGATFSVLRNTVPGLKEKLAFKLEIIPNGQIYSHVGKKHYEQQRFMFSLKGAGFEALDRSPLKYLDLQVGYYASNFLNSDREKGIEPKRHLFVGVGLNLGELLFARSQSRVGRAAYSALDYLQVPYTSLRYDTTGRLGN
ncbi:DUF2279 domain-containing protein [Novosphingobium resinovorum]|uniref:DUF2279 domain-containing protein n=1 Tax=Novosphingobium resinovorum TaxID=158500 RepID=UPI002ED57F1A|nr:DUF2279 domain-containing protein [Novosphingobium resinovorum]